MINFANPQNLAITILTCSNFLLMFVVWRKKRSYKKPKKSPGLWIRFFVAIGLLKKVKKTTETQSQQTPRTRRSKSFLKIIEEKDAYERGMLRMARLYLTIKRLYVIDNKIKLTRNQLEKLVSLVIRLRKLTDLQTANYDQTGSLMQIYTSLRAVLSHAEKTGLSYGGNAGLDKALKEFSRILGEDDITNEALAEADFTDSVTASIKKLL